MSRLTMRTKTGVAVLGVATLLTGCQAKVWGAPASGDDGPARPTMSAPQATMALPPQDPTAPNAAPFDGLDARIRQATNEAAAAGATIEVVALDRTTGQQLSNGVTKPFPIASVVKLFIADDLLLQESTGQTTLSPADRKSLELMLRSSDDTAAQNFWDRSGGNAIITRVVSRYGLSGTTAPYNGHWDVTQSTASDLVRYYDMLLDGTGGLPPAQAEVIMSNLAQSTPSGTDGYPQRFGIPDGLSAEPVAVKQGWFCCWNGANQLHVSTGVIGPERRYVLVISSLQPVAAGTARDAMTKAVRTMFPTGQI